ncbi:hypothetical protein CLOP_g12578 [Closterium sp. NIES-67]|nr:hypothetical protein CLOP_g12578 [Closterium sp. NIES-67]
MLFGKKFVAGPHRRSHPHPTVTTTGLPRPEATAANAAELAGLACDNSERSVPEDHGHPRHRHSHDPHSAQSGAERNARSPDARSPGYTDGSGRNASVSPDGKSPYSTQGTRNVIGTASKASAAKSPISKSGTAYIAGGDGGGGRSRWHVCSCCPRLNRDQGSAIVVLITGLALVGLLAGLDLWIEIKKLKGEIGALGDEGRGEGRDRGEGGGGAKARQRVCELPPGVFKSAERDLLGRIPEYPKLQEALKKPGARQYVKLIHKYLEPWRPIANISTGLGHRGFVTPEALKFISVSPNLMSCSGHVKVIDGKVYFRYGGFWNRYYRLGRFLQTIKMLQDAVTQYRLTTLRLELFLNTCDHPMSFHSSHWPQRGGLPFMSTGFTADTIDIPVPDPLDLTGPYTPDLSSQIPWEKKEARAVFRGKTTNYELLAQGNWGANPRIRLHLMSPAAPHLMDARVNAWSKVEQDVVKRMVKDGVRLAKKMNFQQFNAFKYQIVADGGGAAAAPVAFCAQTSSSFASRLPCCSFTSLCCRTGCTGSSRPEPSLT